MPSCKQCRQSFEVAPDDLAFYDKVSPVFNGKKEQIPAPTLCPECRMQRRFAWRNERNLYHRKCNKSGKQIVSLYSQDKPHVVFAQQEWWGAGWDQFSVGRSFDSSRSLFDQLRELQLVAPRITLLAKNCENSDYTNHSTDNKNCYLSTVLFGCEDVLYSRKIFSGKNIVDCLYAFGKSELLYQCFWVDACYRSTHLIRCSQTSDSDFCIDCRNCSHCFLSCNLRNKQYHFRNEPLSKEEYEKRMREWRGNHAAQQSVLREFAEIQQMAIYPALEMRNCEECSGDYLSNCKKAYLCFDSSMGENMRYCVECDPARSTTVSSNCMDAFGFGNCDWIYEVQAQANGHNTVVNNFSYDVRNCYYVDNCHNCDNCFACIGLKGAKYCVLNRQYTKEEYEALVSKIIARMKADGEWGEFFPMSMSPFGYNETLAQEYFPLTKDEALARGLQWFDVPASKDQYLGPTVSPPENIETVSDQITQQILKCGVSGKPYKIIPQELRFYREMNIPIPRVCPDQRHKERMALRNPRKLWSRSCAKCTKAIETTYAPDRPEIVYCEACYLATVY